MKLDHEKINIKIKINERTPVRLPGGVQKGYHFTAVLNGEIKKANSLIGSPFYIKGEVVPGKQKGRELGFPTLNIKNIFTTF